MKEYITNSELETENLGYSFAKQLKSNDLVVFNGDLGVGKTAFIRGIVRYLSPNSRVTSPTYALVNTYKDNITIYHFDMYRITDEESLYSSGFYDYLNTGAICIIEWYENIEEYVTEYNYKISIQKMNFDNTRKIIIEDKNENISN